ncbi:MAG: carboxypeptidase regulatory-like domain-containing protein [Candidatus Acidiferrum sp.]
MSLRFPKFHRIIIVLSSGFLLPGGLLAGLPAPGWQDPNGVAGQQAQVENLAIVGDIDVYVKTPDGAPLTEAAVVTLARSTGEFVDRQTAKNGHVRFAAVQPTEYTVQVVSPRYQTTSKQVDVLRSSLAKLTIEMKPLSDVEEAESSANFYALAPKTQKEVGKALEALRTNKPNDARKHLEAAQKAAPQSAEIEYLFGVYASQTNDPIHARSYWMRTLELNPNHLSALLAVSQDLLHAYKPGEAIPYLKRATAVAPTSWRAHALLAESFELQHQSADAVKEARRAIELGHERATVVQPILARALAETGEREEAVRILEAYVKAHPADAEASKNLEILKNPQIKIVADGGAGDAGEMAALTKEATALPVPSNWLPPDVDESVPPVVAGTSCNVNDVVSKAGKRIIELVSDVDRFAATETLTHESIDKYGMPSAPEKRKFNYVASIQEVQHGFLNVEEYRSTGNGGPAEFPGGVATNGLPALVLIFHPYNAVDFTMTCEGLARLSSGLAWQVHFRQRPDKPNVIKRYRIGADGPSYPVALKGRAWISSDTYQIVRLETDLVAPIKEIRLAADRADIEYGPVKFAKGDVTMWLPQRADVYYDWKGRRIHRRHSFSDYMLFAVDDKQKISTPKVDDAPAAGAPGGPSDTPKQKP